MTNPVTEVVTRPYSSSFGTGAYTGDETITQTGSQLNMALFKDANLAVQGCSSNPPSTIDANESLTTSANKVKTALGTQVTIHFDLAVNANVAITEQDGTQNPFGATLAIDGDITLTTDRYGHTSCSVHYSGDYCGEKVSCTTSGQVTSSGIVLNNATTTYTFNDPGGNGFAATILSNDQPVNTASGATVTDPHMALQGAGGVVLGAGALLLAFGTHAEDPVQGISCDDAAVIGGMGAAAAAIIANPNSQGVATAAAIALTNLGAKLAVDDTMASYDVVANPHATQTGALHTGTDYWFA